VIEHETQLQYSTAELLRIRAETHARYTERFVDLDLECAMVLDLAEDESLLDVGCGPGAFLRYLRAHGYTGRLAGLDQSVGMIATAKKSSAVSGIEWHVGEADALPFPDGAFTAVSARHMLYHVPDIQAALTEFARVVGPGGTVLAATNGADNLPHATALADDLLAHFGLTGISFFGTAFCTANALELLGTVFPEVRETLLPNALVVTDPEPIVRYVMTMTQVQEVADQPGMLDEMRDWLTAEASARLAAMGGIWRDPKTVGLYRCKAA